MAYGFQLSDAELREHDRRLEARYRDRTYHDELVRQTNEVGMLNHRAPSAERVRELRRYNRPARKRKRRST